MSTISAGTSSGTALVTSGDTTGQLVLQTNGTTTAVTIGTNQVVTLAQPLPVASGGTGATSLAAAGILTTGAAVTVAQGGTGSTSLTANNVLLGNGTSAVQAVAPGTNGNVLTSNGTTWTSAAPAGGGGATSKGSVLIWNYQSTSDTLSTVRFTTFTSDNIFTKPFSSASQIFAASNSYLASISFSSYYNCYFGLLANSSSASITTPVTSTDGQTWTPILAFNANSPVNTVTVVRGIGVNDSTGAIYIILLDTTASTSAMYFSTNGGATWTLSSSGINISVFGAAFASYRYIDSGTASTSACTFTYQDDSNIVAIARLLGNGNNSTGWTVYTGTNGINPTQPQIVRSFGNKLITTYFDGSDTRNILYWAQGTTPTVGALVSTYNIRQFSGGGAVGIAFNNSFWCAPSTTAGSVSYGTISWGSSITFAYVGAVALSNSRAVNACFYDGTRWLAMTTTGLWATTQANPSSGWAFVGTPNLGLTALSQFGSSGNSLLLGNQSAHFQRDVLY
jgi:hypothetical protein